MKRFFSLLLLVALVLQSFSFAAAEETSEWKLTVLHTNDTHAHLENAARLATAVKQELNGVENHLLLSAGDIFSGTLFFNKYNGLADLKFMEMIGYDAMTIGNHEFDLGPSVFADFVKEASFPIVSANIDFTNEPTLSGLTSKEIGEKAEEFPGKIFPAVVLDVNGQKVGVFGLTTEETSNISSPGKNVVFKDVVETAANTVKMFEEKGINKIIALTHIGHQEDQMLAEAVDGIDLIVGGHSHTKVDQPIKIKNTYIVQANEYTKFLGRVDITFNSEGVVTAAEGKLIDLTAQDEQGQYLIPEDPEAKALFEELNKPIEEMKSTVVGKTAVALDGERANVRSKETNLGNLIADGMLYKASQYVNAQIAITNGGGIRASIDQGDITLQEVLTVLPFGNTLVTLELTGDQIWRALENGVSEVENQKGQFPHVAGMKFTYDSSKPAGERVVSVEVKTDNGYVPLDKSATYIVATNRFIADGGDFYASLKEAKDAGKMTDMAFLDYDVFIEYLNAKGEVNPTVEGRIVDLAQANNAPEEKPETPKPAPQPEKKDIVYVVKAGDVLWKIARQFGLEWKELAEYNKLKNPHLILVGQKLLIPVK